MSKHGSDVTACLVLLALMAFTSACITVSVTNGGWETESVEKGFAEYNPQTGAWQWKGSADADPSEQLARDLRNQGWGFLCGVCASCVVFVVLWWAMA